MKLLRHLTLGFVLIFLTTSAAGQDIRWYGFDRDFINKQYSSSSAIGNISVTRSDRARSGAHSDRCGGDDAELHIGALLTNVDLPDAQKPLSKPSVGKTATWGIVVELPNSNKADGKAKFDEAQRKPLTFTGYFRVWDEGHAVGSFHPSNPHHVFEVHPAWAFAGNGVTFKRPDLVSTMDRYRGFNVNKVKPILQAFSNGVWPRAYKTKDLLFVGMLFRQSNFYQLPIKVTNIKKVSGGHEVTVDVFENGSMTNKLYSGLAAITVTGSPIDSELKKGQSKTLLGLFSVNLRKALGAAGSANSVENSHAVAQAVEFFVFGEARNPAIATCPKK
jgi:hypothetical protein